RMKTRCPATRPCAHKSVKRRTFMGADSRSGPAPVRRNAQARFCTGHGRLRENRAMQITKDTIVTLRYRITDAKGKLLDESREPTAYLHGGYDNTLPKIEAALEGHAPGYQVTLALEPEDAFGLRDE